MHKRFRLLACRLVALWLMLMFAPTVSAGMITKIEGTYTGIMPPQSQITTIFTLDVGQATMPTELAGGTVDPTVVTLGTDPFVNLMTIDPMGNNNSFPITVADGTVRFLIGTSPGQIVTNQPGMIVIEQSVSLLSVDPGLVSDGLDFSPLEDAKLIYTIFNVTLSKDVSGQLEASWNNNTAPVHADFEIVPNAPAVPEPGALPLAVLSLLGLVGASWYQRRRRQASARTG